MWELEYLLQVDCQCTFCWITLDLTSHSALVLHHPLLYLLSNIKAYYMQVLRGIGEIIASRSIPKVSNYAKTRLGINFPCLVTMMFWYHSSWVECALLVIYKSICKCNLSNWCLARKMLWSGKLKCTLLNGLLTFSLSNGYLTSEASVLNLQSSLVFSAVSISYISWCFH